MDTIGTIHNSKELEFVVFCVENVAAKLGVSAEEIYRAFTDKSDIIELMQERGVLLDA